MFKNFVRVAVLSMMAATFSSATSLAQAPQPSADADCALRRHRVMKVTPLMVEEYVGRGAVLRGANVFIPAEPGLTAEWLERQMKLHLESMRSAAMPNCPLDIGKLRVEVDSGRAGFWVRLIAPDTKTGQEVLRRAHLMHG